MGKYAKVPDSNVFIRPLPRSNCLGAKWKIQINRKASPKYLISKKRRFLIEQLICFNCSSFFSLFEKIFEVLKDFWNNLLRNCLHSSILMVYLEASTLSLDTSETFGEFSVIVAFCRFYWFSVDTKRLFKIKSRATFHDLKKNVNS